MTSLPTPATRRGWCPGVRRPMLTGDGLLVRVHPAGGVLSAATLRALARATATHGNGLADLSARGNLQIRGVTDETYPVLLGALGRMGLVEANEDGPPRVTLVSPLAGIDPAETFDSLALAAAIDAAVTGLAGLPPKSLVAVDGGGRFPLHDAGADLHVAPALEEGLLAIGMARPDGTRWIGGAAPADMPEAVRTILAGLAALRAAGRTEARRLRDLEPGLSDELAAPVPPRTVSPRRNLRASPRAGAIELGENRLAVLLALPFGRATSMQLRYAASWSERFGDGMVRLSFTRGLLLPGIRGTAEPLLALARDKGFVVADGDPRLAVSACPGGPACASGWVPAADHAAQLASLLDLGATLHVSGCAKGCAHPGPASLTLVGAEGGLYDVVVDGTARDRASARLSFDDIKNRLMRDGRAAALEPAR